VPPEISQLLFPLLLSVLLGGAIGLEREIHGRPAGVRTHILVCLSATMLLRLSHLVDYGVIDLGEVGKVVFDPNRMGAGIVTGIGFLGAATVIRSGDIVRGLTTAACIWFVAALGIVIGAGAYTFAAAGTLVTLLVLIYVNRLARGITPTVYRRLLISSHADDVVSLVTQTREYLASRSMRVLDIASSFDTEDNAHEMVFYISLKNSLQAPEVVKEVAAFDGVQRVCWSLLMDE